MKAPSLTLSGFATALYSSWYFIDELSLLLDCGDGACAGLLQKSRKVRTIAITHGDHDHVNGLAQFLEINARERGLPAVIYPRDSPELRAWRSRWEEETARRLRWKPFAPGATHALGKAKARVEAKVNRHLEAAPGEAKSLSYLVTREHHRLKPRFAGRPPGEIARARARLGEAGVVDYDRETLLAYSGDTPPEEPSFWENPSVLIHESTFLRDEDAALPGEEPRHASLERVMEMTAGLPLEALVLGHFSTRYEAGEIREAIARECRRLRPRFAVHAVLPGELRRDILRSRPEWEGLA